MNVWTRFLEKMGGLFPKGRADRSLPDDDLEIPSEIAAMADQARRRLEAYGSPFEVEEREALPKPRPMGLSLALGLDGAEAKKIEEDGISKLKREGGRDDEGDAGR